MSSSIEEQDWRDQLIPLLFGSLDAQDLWSVTADLPVFPTWLLLWIAPHWKYTQMLTLALPILCSVVYTFGMIAIVSNDGGEGLKNSENSLDFVYNLFKDPNTVYCGWIHYIAYDALVGRAISLDAISIQLPYYRLIMAPVFFLCLMAGPMGFLLYLIIRTIWVQLFKTHNDSEEKTGSRTRKVKSK